MKTLAVWTLMAAVMIVSQPSHAYGQALFHAVLKGAMEDKDMVSAAPEKVVDPEETEAEHRARFCTPERLAAAAQVGLSADEWELLGQICAVDEPAAVSTGAAAMGFGISVVGDSMPCTAPMTVAAVRGELDDEDLDKLDHSCGTPTVQYVNCVLPGGKLDEDCVRRTKEYDRRSQ